MRVPGNAWLLLGAVSAISILVIIAAVLIRRGIIRCRQLETALQAAEQKLHSFFETAPVGIFETNVEGALLSANKTIASMLGYDSPEDLLYHRNKLGNPLYVDPAVRERLVQVLSEKGVIQDYECKWYRKDGTTIWITGNGRVIHQPDGSFHFEGLLYDISERKLAQEQLAHVKSQLELVLNSATGVSIISTDVQGRITIFNPGAERMLG